MFVSHWAKGAALSAGRLQWHGNRRSVWRALQHPRLPIWLLLHSTWRCYVDPSVPWGCLCTAHAQRQIVIQPSRDHPEIHPPVGNHTCTWQNRQKSQ